MTDRVTATNLLTRLALETLCSDTPGTRLLLQDPEWVLSVTDALASFEDDDSNPQVVAEHLLDTLPGDPRADRGLCRVLDIAAMAWCSHGRERTTDGFYR